MVDGGAVRGVGGSVSTMMIGLGLYRSSPPICSDVFISDGTTHLGFQSYKLNSKSTKSDDD